MLIVSMRDDGRGTRAPPAPQEPKMREAVIRLRPRVGHGRERRCAVLFGERGGGGGVGGATTNWIRR